MKRAFLFLLGSFVWLIGGMLAVSAIFGPNTDSLSDTLVFVVLIGFAGLFLSGMGIWSAAKGYHAVLGVALGLFAGPLGLLVLMLLPDKTRAQLANAGV